MVYRGMVLQCDQAARRVGLVTWNDEALEYEAPFFQILILQTPETHVECV